MAGALELQDMKAQLDMALKRIDVIESAKDRQLETAKIQHQARMAERAHEQGMETAEVGHQHALEQQDAASEGAEA